MDKLRAQRYFLHVAETKSFTLAAKKLGVPASSVSRRIKDLENYLGAILVHRSTRIVKLTELGEVYLAQIQPAIRALEYADDIVSEHSENPSGILKITALPGYGRFKLIPALKKLQQRFPEIIPDVELSDEVSNLANNQVDIAIRATAQLPDRVVSRKLSNNRFILVAAPSYLQEFGTPKTAGDLLTHKTLLYRGPNGILSWQANTSTGWLELQTTPSYICNQGDTLVDEAISGAGIALVPEWGLESYLRARQLDHISLEDATVSVSRNPEAGVYLMYHKPKYSVQKIRVAIDFLVNELKEENTNLDL